MRYLSIIYRFTFYAAIGLVALSLFNEATEAWGFDSDTAGEVAQSQSAEDTDATPGLLANLTTLGFLVLLQAVLGFDNLLYISLESKHAPAEKRQMVRSWGIGIAIFLRIGLLCFLVYLKDWFEQTTLPKVDLKVFEASFSFIA